MTASDKENKLEHPCFPQPVDATVKVWRYLDLPKLIWLLENRKLYLSRLDLLNDPHEGSTPRLLASMRDEHLRTVADGKLAAEMPRINLQNRNSTYVSCWHYGQIESEAMWRLYCPGSGGVAIQTTYEKLAQSIEAEPSLYIGCVTYIDYETEGFPLDNMFYPVMHKRISFAHECEVRMVKTESKYWGLPERIGPPGLEIEWNAESIIDEIYVNPYAPDYYHEVVSTIVRRIVPELETHVRWSPMRAAPVY
jgi:hypothetical protein